MRKTWSVNFKKDRTFSQKASAAALWSLLRLVLNPSYEWISYLQTLMRRFKLLVYLIPLATPEDHALNDNSDEFFNDAKSVDRLFGEIISLNCCEQDNLRFRLLQRKFVQQVDSHRGSRKIQLLGMMRLSIRLNECSCTSTGTQEATTEATILSSDLRTVSGLLWKR